MSPEPTRRILVVDDEQVVLDGAKRVLTAEGFEVLCSLDAEAALALMETARPDIALVDLKLPGMSGLDFVDATRSAYPDLVVIVMTGVSSADQAIATLNHKAFDFLPKPFTFDELLGPIYRASRYIELHQTAGTDPGDQSPGETPPAEKSLDEYFFLGDQSWAKPEDDETVRVGISEVFARTAGNVKALHLPELDHQVHQGGLLARITTVDGLSHVVVSPVSGQVVELNPALSDSPLLVNQDPTGKGWLALIRPGELQHDLGNVRRFH
ncbi:response regulator [Bacteroidota bacterium]